MEFGETVCEDDPIQIAVSLDNLALQLEESDATWDEAREAKEEAAAIFRALRGMRHQEISAAQNNGAIMHAYAGDMQRAAEHMALAVAIDLSLEQLAHPLTQSRIAHLHQFWTESDQSDKAARLGAGDFSDLRPIVELIEAEHRAWVAEDPSSRQFGPHSPVTEATK